MFKKSYKGHRIKLAVKKIIGGTSSNCNEFYCHFGSFLYLVYGSFTLSFS